MKETQGIAGGVGKTGQSQVAKEAANVQSAILKTVEQGRQAFIKSQIEASEKGVAKSIASTKAVDEVEKQSANVRLGFLKTVEAGRQDFVSSQIKAAETEAKGIVNAVQKEAGERQRVAREIDQAFKAREAEQLAFQARTLKQAEAAWAGSQKVRLASTKEAEKEGERLLAASNQARIVAAKEAEIAAAKVAQAVQAGTSKFDPAAFWARQGAAATNAAKVTETEAKRVATSVGSALSSAEKASTRATSTVIRDAKTGATLTQAELRKIISGGSKVVESEAKKIGQTTGSILGDLKKLFLQNNFLFRQLGQRIAGDAGFAAVGIGKLGFNLKQLTASSGGVVAGLEGVAASASASLGVLGPLGIAVGVVTVGVVALAAAAVASAAGMFYFAKSVSDIEEHFDDLSRQTGLSTDNLQALDIVSRQSGSNIDKLTNSVGQLQRKLIDASEGGTSRLSVGLKKLGIDLDDPNRALAQLTDLLIKLPAGTVRTGAAMQIFGRGGRDVAGVMDQIAENVGTADGALERLKKQLIDAGVHIDRDGTRTAGKFHDQLILLEAQFESFKRIIGEEALPTVLDAATKFSKWIADNRVQIGEWARDIEHTAESVLTLAGALLKVAAIAALPLIIELRIVPKLIGGFSGEGITSDIARAVANKFGKPIVRGEPAGEFAIAGGSGESSVGAGAGSAAGESDAIAKRIRDAFAPKGKSGGKKGEDPAEVARKLAEISLQETLKGLQAEHDALQRQLDLNLTSRNQYTQDAVNLELKRREATIAGLREELKAADDIRKPGQRAIKVAEINARIREEERRSAKEVQQITDDSAAEQLRIGQSLADSHLRIVETQTERLKARARDYADFRIITATEAAKVEQEQDLRVLETRRRILVQNLRDAGANKEKIQDAQNALDEFDAEFNSFIERSGRNIERGIRETAEHVIQFAAQIRDAFQRAQDVRLDAGEASLEPLRNSILTRHQLWDAELRFEITREEQRHDRLVQNLKDEAELAKTRMVAGSKELAQTLAGINAQQEAEEELHQARLRQLATQAAEQRRQELLQVADDLSSIASDIFDAIGKSSTEFWNSLKQSAVSFAKQIRDELFKGLLERVITGQAQGAEGLIGMIINPLLGAKGGPQAVVADNTKATRDNTAAINALTGAMGGTAPLPIAGGLSGVLQLVPGLFGGSRDSGGPVDAGRVYRVHENEVFFRPDVSGQIVNLGKLGQQGSEVRLNVAVGQDAVDDMLQSHSLTPKGRRAALVRAKYNRKVGKLLFT